MLNQALKTLNAFVGNYTAILRDYLKDAQEVFESTVSESEKARSVVIHTNDEGKKRYFVDRKECTEAEYLLFNGMTGHIEFESTPVVTAVEDIKIAPDFVLTDETGTTFEMEGGDQGTFDEAVAKLKGFSS
jgi:hypothetical protein